MEKNRTIVFFALVALGMITAASSAVAYTPAAEAKEEICRQTIDQKVCENKKTGEGSNEFCFGGGNACSTQEYTREDKEAHEAYKGLKEDCQDGIGTCETSNP